MKFIKNLVQCPCVRILIPLLLGLACLWHYLLWPILNFHFPEYGFPDIRLNGMDGLGKFLGLPDLPLPGIGG